MNAPILQITGLLILIFFTHYTYMQYRRKIFHTYDFIGWTMVWMILILMEIFPQILTPLIQPEFLFFRILDVIIVSATAILLIACFYTYLRLRILEGKMKDLVKTIAKDEKKR